MRQKVSLCLIKFSERERRIILELLSFRNLNIFFISSEDWCSSLTLPTRALSFSCQLMNIINKLKAGQRLLQCTLYCDRANYGVFSLHTIVNAFYLFRMRIVSVKYNFWIQLESSWLHKSGYRIRKELILPNWV